MKKTVVLILLLGLGVLMAAYEQEEDNQLFEALYDIYEQRNDHLNGHSTDTDPWTLYVDTDTSDDVVTELEETYTVEKRDHDLIALGDLHDVVIGYISQLDTSWATVEMKAGTMSRLSWMTPQPWNPHSFWTFSMRAGSWSIARMPISSSPMIDCKTLLDVFDPDSYILEN